MKTLTFLIYKASLYTVIVFGGVGPLCAGSEEVIKNSQFLVDSSGTVPDWEMLSKTTILKAPITEFTAIRTPALCIVDAGGVTQKLSRLGENQSYRLRFQAWRRGSDWSPPPIVSVGGVTLSMERERLTTGTGQPHGNHLDRYSIDLVIRPGSETSDFTVRVPAFLPGMTGLSDVWLEEASLTPTDESVPPLLAALEIMPFWDRAILRTNQTETVSLQVSNPRLKLNDIQVKLVVPTGLEIIGEAEQSASEWNRRDIFASDLMSYRQPRRVPEKNPSATLTWKVRTSTPGSKTVTFEITDPQGSSSSVSLVGSFEDKPENLQPAASVPSPQPAETEDIQVGAILYPGWVPGTGWGWSLLDPYPNRRPALGYYDDSKPEVMDWQIKWALEHGISFFNFCWYRERGNEGQPVEAWRSQTLDEGFLRSRFADDFGFAITWENSNAAGISSPEDLLNNLLPFWTKNYFERPNYLRFDGKPVLFIYSVENLVNQLGGIEHVPVVLDEMRKQCKEAGLGGLILVGEYRGDDRAAFERFRLAGLDAVWSYGMENVETLQERQAWDVLPDIPTISMGWDPRPWQDYINYWWTTHWIHSPTEFQHVAERTLEIMKSKPEGSIGRNIVQVDNWNEFGEGHYIAPSRHFGFAYLEAIRATFAPKSTKPINFLPDEIELGPYESQYEGWLSDQKRKTMTSTEGASTQPE